MARYRDASCRLCRREKMKLMLKGERCLTAKCAITKKREVIIKIHHFYKISLKQILFLYFFFASCYN